MDVVMLAHPFRGFFQRHRLLYDKRDGGVADAVREASRPLGQMVHRNGKMDPARRTKVFGVRNFEDGGAECPDFPERAFSGGVTLGNGRALRTRRRFP